ncbi:MFS transporter [Siminovitchia acidinfaciens]|uniref:MFS transporter n=1 Tax=Siminovitchia acidinfaciens TaxID=2321395 RepID=A0A429Y530_9BACI|nr:MFS transporter [Siminovitchia acidinfaciens]RST76478.1 MFS transporter [Siminovitchia acidinfaciens]
MKHNIDARRAFIASGLGWGLDGFTFTMFALALPGILVGMNMTVAQGGWITTYSLLASAVGGILGGMLADRFGRARVLMYVILAFSVFTALTATAQNPTQLAMWRILEGLAFGAEWPVGAALLAEYASSKSRGKTMGFLQSAYGIGWALSTLSYFAVFSLFPPEVAWRYLFLIGILPALAVFYIRRNVKDRVPVNRDKSVKKNNSMKELFSRKQIRITLLAIVLGFGVQAVYYSVFSFLPLYLKQVQNLSIIGTTTYLWTTITGCMIGYISAGYLHDILGRRPTFTLYFLGSGVTIVTFILIPVSGGFVSYFVALLLGVFAAGQSAGIGAYSAELFPTRMRATGQGFVYNVGRGFAAFGPAFIGVFTAMIGMGNAIMTVGIISCTLAIITVWLLPETKGKVIIDESPEKIEGEELITKVGT